MRAVRVGAAGHGDRGVPLRRHPAHPVRHQRAAGAGLGAPAYARPTRWRRTPSGSRAWTAWTGCWPRPTRGCAPSGWSGRRGHEGLPARRRASAVGCGRSPTPSRSAWFPSAASRCSTSGSTRSTGRAWTRSSSTCTTCRTWCVDHLGDASRDAGRAHLLRTGAARQRGHPRSPTGPGWTVKRCSWPATPTTSPIST